MGGEEAEGEAVGEDGAGGEAWVGGVEEGEVGVGGEGGGEEAPLLWVYEG